MAEGNNNNELKHSRFDRYAPWRVTRLTHEAFLRLFLDPRDIPVIFAKVVGFRVEQVMGDSLHTVEMGVGSHILGNIFWEAVTMHAFGETTIEKNVKVLNDRMKTWEKDNKVKHRYRGRLTKERIRADGMWPKLKSKAIPIRTLAPFAVELAEEFLDEDRQVIARQLNDAKNIRGESILLHDQRGI